MTEVTVAHTPRTGVHTLETGNQDYVFKGGVATLCNSAKLLDREDILKMSYPVRKAGYPAYKSLTLGPPGQGSEMGNWFYVQNNFFQSHVSHAR